MSKYTTLKKPLFFELMVEYLANPIDDRTIAQFCKEIAISETTYFRIQKDFNKELWAEVDRRRQDYIAVLRQRAMKALGKRLDKSDNVLKMALQITDMLVEKSEVISNSLTKEQKEARLEAALERIKAKRVQINEGSEQSVSNEPPDTL